MQQKFIEKFIGISIIVMFLVFNPFISPSLYFDSTGSFVFSSSLKVMLLAVVNTILFSYWLFNVFKKKELLVTSSKTYYFVFLWLFSTVVSVFFSINKLNSIFGFNANLGDSLIESLMLVSFFIFVANNLRGYDSVVRLLRYFNIAISIMCLWFVFRFSFSFAFTSVYFKDYLNSYIFSPSGHYGSILILFLVGLVLSTGFVIIDLINRKKGGDLVVDSITLILSGIGLVNFLNISGKSNNTLYLILILIFAMGLFYMYTSFEKLRVTMMPVLSLILVSVVLGMFSYFVMTSKVLKAFAYPNMPFETALDVSLQSIKNSAQTGLFGNGEGNYSYLFDRFKGENVVLNNSLTQNNNAPFVPEVRINNSGSYLLHLLSTQGVLGFVAFILLAVATIWRAAKKHFKEFDLLGILFLTAFTGVFITLVFTSYDFTLLLVFWLLLAVNIIAIHMDEDQRKLNISVSGSGILSHERSFAYFLPLIAVVIAVVPLFYSYSIASANVSSFWGQVYKGLAGNPKNGSSNNYIALYQAQAAKAVNKFDKSDVLLRELVNVNGAVLLNNLEALQKKVNEDPKAAENQEIQNQLAYLDSYQKGILSNIYYAINNFPHEYKNYYMVGMLISNVSTYNKLAQDASAVGHFQSSLEMNTYHAPAYYQLALLYERNKVYNLAFSSIQLAVKYNPNVIYQLKMADILGQIEGYSEALEIYTVFKKDKDANPQNVDIQNLYKSLEIDKKIEDMTKKAQDQKQKLEDEKKKNSTTPTPTPTQ